jgi:PAT family acetyl-CoA transporter-like MFS transporter 1
VEYGVSKESMAYFSPALVVLGIVVPLGISRFTNGPRPMSVFLLGVPMRIVSGVVFAAALWVTKDLYSSPAVASKPPPRWFWGMFLGATAFNNVASNLMFVSQMSFFNKVSDPVIGGTYMTLLNTLANLGSKWPQSLSLAFLDALTSRSCASELNGALPGVGGACASEAEAAACGAAGGVCAVTRDGYDVQLAVCTALGLAWYVLLAQKTWELQRLPKSAWALSSLRRGH